MESNKPQTTDEIDITQLFRWIGDAFAGFGNSILMGLARLRRTFITYRIFFTVMMVMGLILGSVYPMFLQKKHYTSSMIISSEFLNLQVIQNTIDKLNLLCGENERQGLSELLNVDMATAKNIIKFDVISFVSEDDRMDVQILKEQLKSLLWEKEKQVEGEEVKELTEKVIKKVELNNQYSYKIRIDVFDPGVVKPLEKAIVDFLRNNEYVKKRIETNEMVLMARRKKLMTESKKLDSLKTVIYENFQSMARQPGKSTNLIWSDKYVADPISIYRKDLDMDLEIQEINEELQVKPYFEVVDDLTTFREPSNIREPVILVIAFFGSILAGYILLGLWKFNKYLAKLVPAA